MKKYIWGFLGVGKSSLDVSGFVIEDADSKLFEFKGVAPGDLHGSAGVKRFERDLNYPRNYLEHVQSVDADVVLLNCHVGLLEQLDKDEVLVVYPSAEVMPEYLERYRGRGDDESFISYMADEAEGIIQFIEGSNLQKYKITECHTYLADLFGRSDFKMKLMTRAELTEQLQRAIDLNVIVATYQAGDNAWLRFDDMYADADIEKLQKVVHESAERVQDAARLAEAVLDGQYQVDIDEMIEACIEREEAVKKEKMLLARRGGLSREELADKIMQGIVNGALGIEYDQIAPYSHGYEVTFGGNGPVGSTWDFKNRWECYHCDFFGVPEKIVGMIEKEQQDGRVFGKDTRLLDIREMLSAIDEMEGKRVTAFTSHKDLNWQSRDRYNLGHVATVMDVHAGMGLDGIVQHRYHGDYSSMTPVNQDRLVETLVCMKGFCLDCIDKLDIGADGRQKVIDYLKKKGIDVSTPEKLQAWIKDNPEKCGKKENRVVGLDAQILNAEGKKKVSNRGSGGREFERE